MSGHTYIHTHIHTHTHTYTHTCTHDNYNNPRCAHAHRGLIGERSEPHTYRTVGKNLRHIYIYVFYIYIYIYTSVRRARAVNARATRKRRTGRLRFNGQYNRLENGYFSSKL